MKLKKGDNVVVIAGKDKGSEGEVVRVMELIRQIDGQLMMRNYEGFLK